MSCSAWNGRSSCNILIDHGVGTNGNSSGYHLHFEIWVNGSAAEPEGCMAGVGIDLTSSCAT